VIVDLTDMSLAPIAGEANAVSYRDSSRGRP
jgi:hypothetical protein